MKKHLNPVRLLAVLIIGVAFQTHCIAGEKSSGTTKQAQTVVNLNADQGAKFLATNQQVIVLDVRTPKEFKRGHIAAATNINFYEDFDQKISKLDRNKTYFVYCAIGGRSAEARDKMKKLDFKSIYHLDGGIKGWEKAGKKVVE